MHSYNFFHCAIFDLQCFSNLGSNLSSLTTMHAPGPGKKVYMHAWTKSYIHQARAGKTYDHSGQSLCYYLITLLIFVRTLIRYYFLVHLFWRQYISIPIIKERVASLSCNLCPHSFFNFFFLSLLYCGTYNNRILN